MIYPFKQKLNQPTEMSHISIHYNNHKSSKQTPDQVGKELLQAVFCGAETIILSVDDGDGDVYKFEIQVSCDWMEAVKQINEN